MAKQAPPTSLFQGQSSFFLMSAPTAHAFPSNLCTRRLSKRMAPLSPSALLLWLLAHPSSPPALLPQPSSSLSCSSSSGQLQRLQPIPIVPPSSLNKRAALVRSWSGSVWGGCHVASWRLVVAARSQSLHLAGRARRLAIAGSVRPPQRSPRSRQASPCPGGRASGQPTRRACGDSSTQSPRNPRPQHEAQPRGSREGDHRSPASRQVPRRSSSSASAQPSPAPQLPPMSTYWRAVGPFSYSASDRKE